MTSLHANSKVIAFARYQPEAETLIAAINAGRKRVTLDLRVDRLLRNGQRLVDEWTNKEIVIEEGYAHGIQIASREATVWVAR